MFVCCYCFNPVSIKSILNQFYCYLFFFNLFFNQLFFIRLFVYQFLQFSSFASFSPFSFLFVFEFLNFSTFIFSILKLQIPICQIFCLFISFIIIIICVVIMMKTNNKRLFYNNVTHFCNLSCWICLLFFNLLLSPTFVIYHVWICLLFSVCCCHPPL